MILRRRRAFLLIELLPVLLALAVGGSLMLVGLSSILRSHKRITQLDNRYAVLNDFLHAIRRDVRAATEVTLLGSDDGDVKQELVIGDASRQVLYRFLEGGIQRIGFDGDPVANKRWEMKHTEVIPSVELPTGGGDAVVNVTVIWHRPSKNDPAPRRRFDVTLRCAGESQDEQG